MENQDEYEYISDEPMKCPNCVNLEKGMIGVKDGMQKTIEGNLEMHYLFPNGFILEESFLIARTDLFNKVK